MRVNILVWLLERHDWAVLALPVAVDAGRQRFPAPAVEMTLRTIRRHAEKAVQEAARRLHVAAPGMKHQRAIELRQARTAALRLGRRAR